MLMEEAGDPDQTTTGQWFLPTNNSALNSISRMQFHAQRASNYQTIAGIYSALCVLAMIIVALARVAAINKRLGVTVRVFAVSFPVGLAAEIAHRLLGRCIRDHAWRPLSSDANGMLFRMMGCRTLRISFWLRL